MVCFICLFYCANYNIFKNYSHSLLFLSIALFFIISKNYNNKQNSELKVKPTFKTIDFKLLILGALFLVLSFITYMFPLLIGLIFIFLFCFYKGVTSSNNANKALMWASGTKRFSTRFRPLSPIAFATSSFSRK